MCPDKRSKPDIGIVTTPSSDTSYAEPIDRFSRIVSPSAGSLYLLSGGIIDADISDEISHFVNVGDGTYTGVGPFDYFILQVVISLKLFSLRSELELVYFHKGAMGLALPVVVARLSGVRVCTIKIGAFAGDRISSDHSSILLWILDLLQHLSFRWSHGTVVFSETEQDSVPNDTVFVAYSNYRNFDFFSMEKPPSDREVDIGFVGRFSDVKGILHLLEASKTLTDRFPTVQVRLVGDGPRFNEVVERTKGAERIELTGWVEQDELPDHYNDIRFLFIPSVGEGLPTTALEAMGCGAVVVATPVGSLVDLIEDGQTGFFLEDNSPDTIEDTFMQLDKRSDLNAIAANQREFVVANYSLSAAQEKFNKITLSMFENIKRT